MRNRSNNTLGDNTTQRNTHTRKIKNHATKHRKAVATEDTNHKNKQTKQSQTKTHLPKQHGQHHFVAFRRQAFREKNVGRLLLRRGEGGRRLRRHTGIGRGFHRFRQRRRSCCSCRVTAGLRGVHHGGHRVVVPLSPLGPGHVGSVSLRDTIRLFPGVGQL